MAPEFANVRGEDVVGWFALFLGGFFALLFTQGNDTMA